MGEMSARGVADRVDMAVRRLQTPIDRDAGRSYLMPAVVEIKPVDVGAAARRRSKDLIPRLSPRRATIR